jgi:hypothetical protein
MFCRERPSSENRTPPDVNQIGVAGNKVVSTNMMVLKGSVVVL